MEYHRISQGKYVLKFSLFELEVIRAPNVKKIGTFLICKVLASIFFMHCLREFVKCHAHHYFVELIKYSYRFPVIDIVQRFTNSRIHWITSCNLPYLWSSKNKTVGTLWMRFILLIKLFLIEAKKAFA